MNNKVCCFVFSYFRREWHATSDIVLSHVVTLPKTLSSWRESWPVPMSGSWYVTLLSFWFIFTQASVCWSLLITFIILLWCCSMFQKIEFSSFSVSPVHQISWPHKQLPLWSSAHPTSRASLGTSLLAVSTSSLATGVWADQSYEERNLQAGQCGLACLCLSCVLRPGQCQLDCQPVRMVRCDATTSSWQARDKLVTRVTSCSPVRRRTFWTRGWSLNSTGEDITETASMVTTQTPMSQG